MSTLRKAPIYLEIRRKHQDWEFPNFSVEELQPKKHNYCVCVFVINEGQKIQRQLERMKKNSKQLDIIIADGGSTDGSLELSFLKSVNVRTLLTKQGPGKLSAQMRMAFAYAMYEGYDGVVAVDGNDKDHTSAIPDFIRLLSKGYDHIQGSRFIQGGQAINTPLERLIAVRMLHAPLLSLASHHRHTDTTNGFRAYSRNLLLDPEIAVFRDTFKTYELHYYLAVESARAKKFKLIETPVTRRYPKKGKTPTKISPLKGNAHVLGILIKAARRKYRP
jgi:glycosyltransferase involved in cell wall biosynthesis